MAFDATYRIIWESGATDNLNKQILSAVHEIEEAAGAIRAENEKPTEGGRKRPQKSPTLELKPRVDALRQSLSLATAETVAAIDDELAAVRQVWKTDRDAHPDREAALLLRARNRISGMTDQEAVEAALAYADGQEDFDYCTLNELKSRLRTQGESAEAEAQTLNDAIKQRNGNRPWLQDPEVRDLLFYRDRLSELNAGETLYMGNEGLMAFDVGDLVDFDNELAQPGPAQEPAPA